MSVQNVNGYKLIKLGHMLQMQTVSTKCMNSLVYRSFFWCLHDIVFI